MKKTSLYSIGAVGLVLTTALANAATQPLDTCISAIQKQKPGELIKLEKLIVSGKPVYEFEVKDSSGNEWEFMCNAQNGKITEQESEVINAENEAFKKHLKISEADATATALKAHPGKVQEVEYEIEANGDASYEIDIISDKGVETKVEVDAGSGKIIETATETWEIGEEADEKR
ncbi:MAG: PepSY domain-containing protein [Methylococcales bacterium]